MAETRPIFVISDLHLGSGGARDNFDLPGRRQQLDLFLDYVAQCGGELVVLGDLFEFWQMNFSRIVVRHRPLLDRLAAGGATYVLGNHDADLIGFLGTDLLAHPLFQRMSGPFERTVGGKRIKFMHGHEVDPVNRGDAPGWGRIFCILAGIAEDKHGSPKLADGSFVEDRLEGIGDKLLDLWQRLIELTPSLRGAADVPPELALPPARCLTPAQNPARARDLLDLYAADRRTGGYEILIAGHTHQPGRLGDWYFNSGSWARQQNTFVEISPAGVPTVCTWTDGRPGPCDIDLGVATRKNGTSGPSAGPAASDDTSSQAV